MKRKTTDLIVVHCAATKPSMDIGVKEIDRWHRQRGWFSCGYHFVIRRDGLVEAGREIDDVGAHARPVNGHSIGICLVGGIDDAGNPDPNFTLEQMDALQFLIESLQASYPGTKVIGHNEISEKACPSFDVQHWLQTGDIQAVT